MIAVVDSGGANLASVLHALERLGAPASLTRDAAEISGADKVILPGVGAAARAMERLREDHLIECLRERRGPTLGICLGMQLLFQRSEEGPADTLGLLDGQVRKLDASSGLSIPHMGWNDVARAPGADSYLLRDIPAGSYFYFVHSYRADITADTRGICRYGEPFAALVERGNLCGVQFHPERSGEAGAKLLRNFLERA